MEIHKQIFNPVSYEEWKKISPGIHWYEAGIDFDYLLQYTEEIRKRASEEIAYALIEFAVDKGVEFPKTININRYDLPELHIKRLLVDVKGESDVNEGRYVLMAFNHWRKELIYREMAEAELEEWKEKSFLGYLWYCVERFVSKIRGEINGR